MSICDYVKKAFLHPALLGCLLPPAVHFIVFPPTNIPCRSEAASVILSRADLADRVIVGEFASGILQQLSAVDRHVVEPASVVPVMVRQRLACLLIAASFQTADQCRVAHIIGPLSVVSLNEIREAHSPAKTRTGTSVKPVTLQMG